MAGTTSISGGVVVMNFQVLPPEINSLLMYSGAGSAPMSEAAAAWDALASEMGSAASSFASGHVGTSGSVVAGCGVGRDDGCGGAVFGMAEGCRDAGSNGRGSG